MSMLGVYLVSGRTLGYILTTNSIANLMPVVIGQNDSSTVLGC